MKTYEKIETLYQRDIEGTKKLMPGVYRNPTIEYLKDNIWQWTEKVDGTNIRVQWDGHSVSFGGRTERASIPAPLVNRLNERFGGEENAQLFEQLFGEREVILFGEGYGAGIQKVGKAYKADGVDFILFDLLIGSNYQPRESVERCAQSFGIGIVPIRCVSAEGGAAGSRRRARHLQNQMARLQRPVRDRAKERDDHG